MTERNFDHLNENGENLPIVKPTVYVTIPRSGPGSSIMTLLDILVFHAERDYHYRYPPKPDTDPSKSQLYTIGMGQLVHKLLEVYYSKALPGMFTITGIEPVTEDSTLQICALHEWKEVSVKGRFYYQQRYVITR